MYIQVQGERATRSTLLLLQQQIARAILQRFSSNLERGSGSFSKLLAGEHETPNNTAQIDYALQSLENDDTFHAEQNPHTEAGESMFCSAAEHLTALLRAANYFPFETRSSPGGYYGFLRV